MGTLLRSCVKVRKAIELPFGVELTWDWCIRWGPHPKGEREVLGVLVHLFE